MSLAQVLRPQLPGDTALSLHHLQEQQRQLQRQQQQKKKRKAKIPQSTAAVEFSSGWNYVPLSLLNFTSSYKNLNWTKISRT